MNTNNTATATATIKAGLAAWLGATGNTEVPRRTRVTTAHEGSQITIQGATVLTDGWVRLWDGERAWNAALLNNARAGKAGLSAGAVR